MTSEQITALGWLKGQSENVADAIKDFDQANQSQVQGAWFRLAAIGVMALSQLAYSTAGIVVALANKDKIK